MQARTSAGKSIHAPGRNFISFPPIFNLCPPTETILHQTIYIVSN